MNPLAKDLNSARIAVGALLGAKNWAPEIAAALAAVKASESDPAMPLNGLVLAGIKAPSPELWPTRNKQEAMLRNGYTPLIVGPGQQVQIVRLLSTYTKDNQGNNDTYFLDLPKICAADYVREACRLRVSAQFSRVKHTQKTRDKIRSLLLATLYELQDLEIVMDVDRYKDDLVVMPDPTDDTRSNARIPAAIVPGLHIFAAEIALL